MSEKLLIKYLNEFGPEGIETTDGKLVCKICECDVKLKKYLIQQHLRTLKHIRLAQNSKQQNEENQPEKTSLNKNFCLDLCNMMVATNIPFWKLENVALRSFLEKYTREVIPSESTIRKNYLSSCYANIISEIKENLKGKKIWMSIDETTDAAGRFVVNIIVGILRKDLDNINSVYLLDCQFVDKSDATTMARAFDNAFKILDGACERDDVLLVVTDAAPYMVKMGKGLSILYPNLTHVTCLAHGLHRLAEHIRSIFSDVDTFINNLKKIFLKSPSRIAVFKRLAPNLPLPPQPVVTRWGTWLRAVEYCSNNFDILKIVFAELEKDAASIVKCAHLIAKIELRNDIDFITTNYRFIPNKIEQLEASTLSLNQSLTVIEEVFRNIENVPGSTGEQIKTKLKTIFQKNSGLQKLKEINKVLRNELVQTEIINAAYFKYAPITSCDVERSFSQYKNILSDKRLNFKTENLKLYVVTHCNFKNCY